MRMAEGKHGCLYSKTIPEGSPLTKVVGFPEVLNLWFMSQHNVFYLKSLIKWGLGVGSGGRCDMAPWQV